MSKKCTITDLMLQINKWDVHLYYHKDTNAFDMWPVSEVELKNLDSDARIPMKDENNFRFLTYEEINHKEIMSFFVKECVEDKEVRKQLFYILRRDNYVDAYIEALRNLDLYEEFEMVCGDVYHQIFHEWAEKYGLEF